jgi:hypothetical protein
MQQSSSELSCPGRSPSCMEPGGSQGLVTGLYPECAESSQKLYTWIVLNQRICHFSICHTHLNLCLNLRFSDQDFMCVSHLPILVTCSAHRILLDLSSSLCTFLKISCQLYIVRLIYYSQHFFLIHLQCMFFLRMKDRRFEPT